MRLRRSTDGMSQMRGQRLREAARRDVAALPRPLGIARNVNERVNLRPRDDLGQRCAACTASRRRPCSFQAGRACAPARRRRSPTARAAKASRRPEHSAHRRTGHGAGRAAALADGRRQPRRARPGSLRTAQSPGLLADRATLGRTQLEHAHPRPDAGASVVDSCRFRVRPATRETGRAGRPARDRGRPGVLIGENRPLGPRRGTSRYVRGNERGHLVIHPLELHRSAAVDVLLARTAS